MKVSQLKLNKKNPRKISPQQMEKLKASIQKFPKMMSLRPIVYDPDTMEVLGGNQRLLAIRDLGMKEIPDDWAKSADELTEEEKREFIIRDNIQAGDWDFEILSAEFGEFDLDELGLDMPEIEETAPDTVIDDENPYTKLVASPIYEITGEKPAISELYDDNKYKSLLAEIEKANITQAEKDFLSIAAQRHIVFRYDKIAEFYAHSTQETQQLMENSALVIIDFQKAIELGYVKLAKDIAAQYGETYPNEDA